MNALTRGRREVMLHDMGQEIRRRKRILKVLLSVLLVGISLLAYTFVEPYWLKIRKISILDPDIPGSFDGKRIVFLADIHHGPFFSIDRVRRLVDTVNRLHPDMILLGGDYVHREPKYIVPCFVELKRLQAPLGRFGVLGNHDHWEDAALTRKCMAEAGIDLIENRGKWVYDGEDRTRIGGVGDLWEDAQDLDSAVEGTAEGDFVVLVSHNPDYAEEISSPQVDLVLSGHTHGGQVSLFGWWAPCVPSRHGQKYRTGKAKTRFTTVLISNGVGTITPPVRFCTRPDILLLTLRREAAVDGRPSVVLFEKRQERQDGT